VTADTAGLTTCIPELLQEDARERGLLQAQKQPGHCPACVGVHAACLPTGMSDDLADVTLVEAADGANEALPLKIQTALNP
jgi:hypothetical protein